MTEDTKTETRKPEKFGFMRVFFGVGDAPKEERTDAPGDADAAPPRPESGRDQAPEPPRAPTEASVPIAAGEVAPLDVPSIGAAEPVQPVAEPPSDAPPPEPVPAEPIPAEPVQAEPVLAEPVQAETVLAEPVQAETVQAEPAQKRSWWTRLREGLARSSSSIGTGISDIFTKRKLDDAALEDLEDVLIRADLGVAAATRISQAVGKGRYDKQIAPDEVKAILAGEVERVLAPYARPLDVTAKAPFVILVVGVNGSGKTTTIGKLTAKLSGEGRKVMLAAGDTFRAAAIEQLRIWGGRFGVPVVARAQGSDAAGLAYEAIEEARAAKADVLLMDTAGRLQNRAELMAELEKIIRVMRKLDASAPHAVLLVLDATVGQNAMSQVEIFGKVAGVTGLVMTKLDGTARGGILVAIAETFKLPVHFIGVGETAEDLEPFEAADFAAAIAGIERR